MQTKQLTEEKAIALRAAINERAASIRDLDAAAHANGRWTFDLVKQKSALKQQVRDLEFELTDG